MISNRNLFAQIKQGNADENDISTFLENQLGVPLQLKQDKSIIEAIATPTAFIENRGKKVKALTAPTSEIVKYYKNTLDKHITAGLPAQEAHELAFASFKAMYDSEKSALDILYPGYEKAFGIAEIEHNALRDRAGLTDKKLTMDGDEKARMKAKYKNKYKYLKHNGSTL